MTNEIDDPRLIPPRICPALHFHPPSTHAPSTVHHARACAGRHGDPVSTALLARLTPEHPSGHGRCASACGAPHHPRQLERACGYGSTAFHTSVAARIYTRGPNFRSPPPPVGTTVAHRMARISRARTDWPLRDVLGHAVAQRTSVASPLASPDRNRTIS